MKHVIRGVFSSMASLIVAAAVCAWPAATTRGAAVPNAIHEQAAAPAQSVSGKIASVGKTSFTLTVASDGMSKVEQNTQDARPKTMTFSIDKNTTIDGNLQVGANADVTYREDNGKNIAISVRVTP
jgi:hypothetical protein